MHDSNLVLMSSLLAMPALAILGVANFSSLRWMVGQERGITDAFRVARASVDTLMTTGSVGASVGFQVYAVTIPTTSGSLAAVAIVGVVSTAYFLLFLGIRNRYATWRLGVRTRAMERNARS